jgi:hypothetical protein
MQGIWRKYDGFRKHPTRHVRVAVAFRPLRFGAFATLSDVADGIGHTYVETDSMQSWITK